MPQAFCAMVLLAGILTMAVGAMLIVVSLVADVSDGVVGRGIGWGVLYIMAGAALIALAVT